ncbi:YbjN domain-containing protein [Hydrogenophaga atypica]|uniref:YbjN domain-containing protein n=1 Tax=Hydrogenophaga atypica TaxID=249409 RepID=A0ABW2QRS3_9BURK
MSLDTLIEEKNVNIISLSLELEKATIAYEMTDEKTIYVREIGMFPFWIYLRENTRFITLSTYLEWAPDVPEMERLAFCNRVNEQLILPSVYMRTVDDEGVTVTRFTAAYPIYYRDGLLVSQFIRLCRRFADAIREIQAEFDPAHEVLQAL